jgi:hypothetical protein
MSKIIKVKSNVFPISEENIKEIIQKYNEIKENTDLPIEILGRAEGGFQIKFGKTYFNDNIRQLRWSSDIRESRWSSDKILLPKENYHSVYSYINFLPNERELLFQSMKHVIGENSVFLE